MFCDFKQTVEQAEKDFSIETCLKQSLLNCNLSVSHMKIGSLPLSMGDTLFLQFSHLKRINVLGNDMSSLLTYKTPQMSAYHIRYVHDLNLSCNDLSRLCPDFGVLRNLQILNLSQNNMSTLPASISQLDKLRILDMSRNNIKEIPPEIGELRFLGNI